MILPPRQHTSCSSNVISACAAIVNLLHRARTSRILEHPGDTRSWHVPKIQTLAAGPGGLSRFFGSQYRERTFLLVGNVDSRGLHRIARRCAWTSRCCSVSGQKHGHPKTSASRSKLRSSRDHTRPPKLSFALASVLTMNARRFQRTHPLSEMGPALNASKDIDMGVTDSA